MPDKRPYVDPEPWLDKKKLAEHFSCSVRSIEFAMTRGLPHAIIFGRPKFHASEAEAWLEARGELQRHGDEVRLPPATDERRAA